MHNKVKLETCFTVTSVKRIAILQASLKLVREGAGAQLHNMDNKCLHLMDQNTLSDRGTVNKTMH